MHDADDTTIDFGRTSIEDLLAEQTPRRVRLCDYCGERASKGYVRQYDAHVCCECYEDHHGPAVDVEPAA